MKKYISFIISLALLICTAAISASATEGKEYSPTDAKIRKTGRCAVSDNAVSVGYGLTELNFNVKASSVKCNISTDLNAPQSPYFAVYVDGELTNKFTVTQGNAEYTLASGLSSEKITNIRLVKTNERWMNAKIGTITVAGEIVDPTAEKSRHIEVIGDSISAAYGILTSDDNAADDVYTDATYGYAKILADKMGAEVSLIANSGKGIYCNSNGEVGDTLPSLYDKVLPGVDESAFDHSSVNPDLIIVNLGTNDSYGMKMNKAITEENISEAIIAFVRHLREIHPDAHIVWTYGLMNSDLKPVIETAVSTLSATDSKVSYIPLPSQSEFSDGFGKGSHPDVAANKATADYLFEKLIDNGIIGSDMPGYLAAETDAAWEFDPSKMQGDANNDYSVNILDLVRLKKYSANKDTVAINSENADYNLDGEIDTIDLICLKKDLLKY